MGKKRKKGISAEESKANSIYNKALLEPVNEKSFLLEAGQGKAVNGNVFALLKTIRKDPAFDSYDVVLALSPDKQEEACLKFRQYGINNVEFAAVGSPAYMRALAVSKYLITDNSFPAYFFKRPQQICLNTWHGTPLKALGRTDLDNAISIGNVQANMAKADYLLHPNRFTRRIMMKDYMMEKAFTHRSVIMDYPRNDALHNAEYAEEISEKYGLKGKKVYAYMPTWRGAGRDADVTGQISTTKQILAEMDRILSDDEVLFVNLHFLLGQRIDTSDYSRIRSFPPEYETYDFLAACDVLITDYSSVSVDFAGTGKDIILYIYDYEQYRHDKGFYLDVKDLPFKKAYTAAELAEKMHSQKKEYRLDPDLQSPHCGESSRLAIKMLTEGCEAGIETESIETEDFSGSKGVRVAYFENIVREESRSIIRGLTSDIALMFPDTMNAETVRTLKMLSHDMDFIRISGRLYCSNDEFRILRLNKKYGLFRKRAEKIYLREAYRNIGQFGISSMEVMYCKNRDRISILKALGGSRHFAIDITDEI